MSGPQSPEIVPKRCGEFTVEEQRRVANAVMRSPGARIRDQLDDYRRGIKGQRPFYPMGPTVYFIASADGFVKIGFTTNLTSRLCDLQGANPVPLKVLARVRGHRDLEREYHRRFAADRHFYEWFVLSTEIEDEIARLQGAAHA